MGLDVSHDAFKGSYSAFNRLRKFVCNAMGGDCSFPPHSNDRLDDDRFYIDDKYSSSTHPGLLEFLAHSDCDGEISPDMCVHVADELESLLPRMDEIDESGEGHIALNGGYAATIRKFIAGCRAAAEEGVPLEFD